MEKEAERGVDWVHLPVITAVARLLCRETRSTAVSLGETSGARPEGDSGGGERRVGPSRLPDGTARNASASRRRPVTSVMSSRRIRGNRRQECIRDGRPL